MRIEKIAYGLLAVTLTVTATQSIVRGVMLRDPPILEAQDCKGTPIIVPYSYGGGMLDPHECKVQCDEGVQKYILYSDGQATQCQDLPGCNDTGEDRGVTCIPPGAST